MITGEYKRVAVVILRTKKKKKKKKKKESTIFPRFATINIPRILCVTSYYREKNLANVPLAGRNSPRGGEDKRRFVDLASGPLGRSIREKGEGRGWDVRFALLETLSINADY